MFKTVRSKFIFFSIAVILVSIGFPTWFLYRQWNQNFTQRSMLMLETTADVVRSGFNQAMQGNMKKDVQGIIEDIGRNENINHIRVFAEDGTIKYSSNKEEVGQDIRLISPDHILFDHKDSRQISIIGDGEIYLLHEPILNRQTCQRCHSADKPILGYFDMDTRLTQAEKFFYTGSNHVLYLAIVSVFLLISGFLYLFNRLIKKPMDTFLLALKKIERGRLDTRLAPPKEAEFNKVSQSFNQMVERINTSQTEIEQLHFEQMQRADKMVTLGELAAEMAHEINNPAGIILSRTDYLKMESMKNEHLKSYLEDLDVIFNQTIKVSQITGSILKYSKKLPKNFKKINLREVIEESLSILIPRLDKLDITIEKHFGCQKPIVSGDPVQLEQVFTNLINNAADAMPGGGTLKIRQDCNENNHLKVQINDTGEGMEENVRRLIFTPFYTTKPADRGTGLGLYIVKNICSNHDVGIDVTSQPNQGTTFTLHFKCLR